MIKVKLINLENDNEVGMWAFEHCPSFNGWVQVTPDTAMLDEEVDTQYIFHFIDERDAVIFQLRWQGQENE